jgi:hypothetical protein
VLPEFAVPALNSGVVEQAQVDAVSIFRATLHVCKSYLCASIPAICGDDDVVLKHKDVWCSRIETPPKHERLIEQSLLHVSSTIDCRDQTRSSEQYRKQHVKEYEPSTVPVVVLSHIRIAFGGAQRITLPSEPHEKL